MGDRITSEPDGPGHPIRLLDVLRGRDFRLLWGGEFASLLGSQFFTVALPWLVLRLTGDPLAIGAITAVGAAPRSVFILLGGAIIDRTSPRGVMLYSNLARMVLVGILAILTVLSLVQGWMLYAFNFMLGLGYALYLPAQSSIIPRLVREERLQTGNAIIQGTAQLSLFLGPVLAGVLIALLGEQQAGSAGASRHIGIGVAFALNAVTFLVSAVTLSLIRLPPWHHEEEETVGIPKVAGAVPEPDETMSPGAKESVASGAACEDRPGEGWGVPDTTRGGGRGTTATWANGARGEAGHVFRSLGEGLACVWRDKTLRLYFILIGAVNLVLLGPITVGLPVLADTRFSGGALAYGAILSGLGGGAVAGVVAGGVLRRPPGRAFAGAMLGSVVVLGVGLALVGALPSAPAATGAAFFMGVAEGYLTVEFITWLQLRSSKRQLGRMISILLFASVGQAPFSNLLFGALVRLSATWAMIGAGIFIVLVAVVAGFSPSVWRLHEGGVTASR